MLEINDYVAKSGGYGFRPNDDRFYPFVSLISTYKLLLATPPPPPLFGVLLVASSEFHPTDAIERDVIAAIEMLRRNHCVILMADTFSHRDKLKQRIIEDGGFQR